MRIWRFPATREELKTLEIPQLEELCAVINAIMAYCEGRGEGVPEGDFDADELGIDPEDEEM